VRQTTRARLFHTNSLKAGRGGISKVVKERVTINKMGGNERVCKNDGIAESEGTANLTKLADMKVRYLRNSGDLFTIECLFINVTTYKCLKYL